MTKRAQSTTGRSRTDARLVRELREHVVAWFRVARRELPWRADRDPYRVWISEAMLQQTRVEAVLEHYRRFLARFPDVESLAAAPVEDVLAAWSGLGYYRRARSLHSAARAIAERHAGRFPRTADELLDLPGVGPYTAGAVASIAFDEPAALVDGNVSRVLARIFALEGATGSRELGDAAWSIARELVPERGAGEWNQALMELGALVCTPARPRCEECPARRVCRALAESRVAELPRPKPRRAAIDVELVSLVVAEGGRVLVARRPAESARMPGLWELPTVERSGDERLHPREWPRAADGSAAFAEDEPLFELRHTITHHRIRARVARGVLLRQPAEREVAWHAPGSALELGLTGLARKALRRVDADRCSAARRMA